MERVEIEFDLPLFVRDIQDAGGKHASTRELERRVGVSASTINRIFNGSVPDMNSFITICSHLDLPPGNYFKRVVWQKVDEP